MGKTYVLDRVAADLARGFTHPAIQRLSSLVAAYPTDLDLRRRLAAVHRRVGNRIQAGRWDYLTIGADAGDTAAFERAFPSAAVRLREVRWPYRANQAATSYARARLEKLVLAAQAEQPGRRGRCAAAVATANGSTPDGGRTAAPDVHATGGNGHAARVVPPPGSRRIPRRWSSYSSRRSWCPGRVAARPWRVPSAVLAVTGMVAAFFVALGAVTVVQWFIP